MCVQVDNQTYRMFKDLALTQPQKEQLGDMWTIWETRKRRLDVDMQAARSLLATLPSSLPVPCSLLSHLSLLTQSPPHSPAAQQQECPAPTQHVAVLREQPQPQVAAEALRSHALESPWGSSVGTATSQEMSHSLGWQVQLLQCLGQDAEATQSAAGALWKLREVSHDLPSLTLTVFALNTKNLLSYRIHVPSLPDAYGLYYPHSHVMLLCHSSDYGCS